MSVYEATCRGVSSWAAAAKLRTMQRPAQRFPKAILFDMDGTLTKPMLNFPAIKAEMEIGSRPILEAMAEMDAAAREAAEKVLFRHEETAAQESTLNEGCEELLAWIRKAGLPTALITRNCARSVRIVLDRHRMAFDVVIAREDGPFKPNPWSIHHTCERLGVRPDEAWMVGDGQYDIEAGNAAGAITVWISHDRRRPFASEPTMELRDLIGLQKCLTEIERG